MTPRLQGKKNRPAMQFGIADKIGAADWGWIVERSGADQRLQTLFIQPLGVPVA